MLYESTIVHVASESRPPRRRIQVVTITSRRCRKPLFEFSTAACCMRIVKPGRRGSAYVVEKVCQDSRITFNTSWCPWWVEPRHRSAQTESVSAILGIGTLSGALFPRTPPFFSEGAGGSQHPGEGNSKGPNLLIVPQLAASACE